VKINVQSRIVQSRRSENKCTVQNSAEQDKYKRKIEMDRAAVRAINK
jgi:hypothetical protein